MPGVLFTNALMLAGLFALAVPVIIHLLLKRKKKRLPFSTLRFFVQHDEQSSQKRKLRNLLLLAVRLLLFTTLVLAFSRPYLPLTPGSAENQPRRQVAFVLDRSASMLAADTDGQRWTKAKVEIQRVLDSLRPGDRAALIGCSGEAEILSGFAPPASVAQLLATLEPTYGLSTLDKGLKQAVRLLADRDKHNAATIYLVSDLQQSACQSLAACPVPREIEFKLLPVGDLYSPNLALTQAQTETVDEPKPQLGIANFSDEDASNVTLEFAIAGKVTSTQVISLKSGSSTNIDFPLAVMKPGWHDLQASIRSKDGFAVDNVWHSSLFVPEPLRVLVIEPRKSKRVFEEASFFLMAALDPAMGSTNTVHTPFRVTQITPEELDASLPGRQSQPAFDLVMLPGLKEIPANCAKALGDFVRTGGGLVLFLGEGVSANRYNADFRDLLPAPLANPEVCAQQGLGWRILDFDTNTAAFAAFRRPNSGDLGIPEFTRRYAFSTLPATGRLAHFDDTQPLLLSRDVGRGRVVLANTSADASWSDWPKHKTFVPWLHGLGKYAVRNTVQDRPRAAINVFSGEEIEIDLGRSAARAPFKVQLPASKEVQLQADDEGRLRFQELAKPGVYSVRDRSGQEVGRVVANLPTQESDLAALRPAEFEQRLVRADEPRKGDLLASLFGSPASQKELWTALLLAALALLFIEPIIANRTTA